MSQFPFVHDFDNHIKNSIPCFSFVDDFICSYFRYINNENCSVLDIDCSSGRLVSKLQEICPTGRIIGIDYEKDFNCKTCIKTNFLDYKGSDFDLIVSVFTNNFIKAPRQIVYERIKDKLNKEGSAIIFEKIISETGFEEKINSEILRDLKSRFFTSDEILKKEKTIMPLMRDLTEVEIEKRLLSSGLVIVSKPWKVLNFASWIVKKA